MLNLVIYNKFKKDMKLMEKRGKDLSKLRSLLSLLQNEQELPEHYQDHQLKGDWKDYRDAHIEPDWLLIYRIEGNNLLLARTGTHSDLF